MSSITNKKNQIVAPIAIAIVALFAIFTIYRQWNNPYVWCDESGQFFISQGHNHNVSPYSQRGSLGDVLYNNHDYNLDPGGYSIILYYWNLISTNTYFTRLLSVLFFIGALLCIWKISMTIHKNVFYATLQIIPLLISSYVVKNIALIRPYSMVMCGIFLALLLLIKYKDNFTYSRVLTLSIIVALFCTSRYEYIIFAFIFSLYVIFLIYKQSSSVLQFDTKVAVYGTIPLLAVFAIWFFQMRYQTPSVGISNYIGSISHNFSALRSTMSLLFYLQIILLIYFLIRKKRISAISWTAFGNALIVFILALCNRFPWSPEKCIATYILLLTSCTMMLIQIISVRLKPIWMYGVSCLCLFGICATVYLSISNKAFNFRYFSQCPFIEYERLDLTQFNKIFIGSLNTTDVIYMYEYGLYRDRQKLDNYPNKFYFQKGVPPTPIQSQKSNIDLNKTIVSGCDLYWFWKDAADLNKFSPYHGSRYFFTEK